MEKVELKSCIKIIYDDGSCKFYCKGCNKEFDSAKSARGHTVTCKEYLSKCLGYSDPGNEKAIYEENYNKYYDILKDLYLDKNLSEREIGRRLNIPRSNVSKLIHEFGLALKSKEQIQESRVKSYSNTCIELYGVDNASKRQETKDRIKQTWIRNYGVDHPFKCQEIKDKAKNTYVEHYGVDHPWKSEEIKEKIRKTNLQKYGFENVGSSLSVRNKMRQTWIRNYGVDHPWKLEEIRKEINETILEKYGVPYACLTKACRMSILPNSSKEFANIFENFNSKVDYEYVIEDRSYDLIINDSILIEINDTYSHNSTRSPYYRDCICDPYYHLMKTEIANENGYHCVHIFDWDNPDKIAKIFNPEKERVYARNCEVKLIENYDVVKEFLNINHLQGSLRYDKSMIAIGLYHNSELKSIMLFGKPRYTKRYNWELLRLCSDLNFEIIGGNSKMFKYFIKNFKPESIISYCDRAKFTGQVYPKLGFKFDHATGPTPHWFNGQNHFTDALLRQRGADQLIKTNYGKGTNNEEIMINHGYVQVYDCGQEIYIWRNVE